MLIGETFSTSGYDVVASAQHHETGAAIVVLNNNSTHYLVAERPVEPGDDTARLLGSFAYRDPDFCWPAYRDALTAMAHRALSAA